MLTDIFDNRYAGMVLWENIEEKEIRLLVQAFRIISEQFYPYYYDGNESTHAKAKWKSLNNKLSMELGLENLSALAFTYPNTIAGQTTTQVSHYALHTVCKNFVCQKYDGSHSADRFMKERISFIEIAFREKENDIEADISRSKKAHISQKIEQGILSLSLGSTPTLKPSTPLKTLSDINKEGFLNAVNELNTRFKQAGCNLHYHNGFIQRSTDQLTEEQIEDHFWPLISDVKWANVDTDMKEAIDRRDNQDRDPALYAAKALESTIKIISAQKGWTHGGERGAQNYLDNLGSQKNKYINDWEKKSLKDFFGNVRNPLGHGPGNEPMPELTSEQTDWAIEFCMIWIKTLIRRL